MKPPVQQPRSDEPRINRQIRADSIRLVDADGTMIGVVSVDEGIRRAELAGMDLVEISPNAEPPVCKVLDYGKYKYALQKRANEARKNQKVITIKEVKLRPTIEKHDLEVKIRSVMKFLEEGDKVKLTLRFRGREIAHQELGIKLLAEVRAQLSAVMKVEQEPRLEGKQMMMVISPLK